MHATTFMGPYIITSLYQIHHTHFLSLTSTSPPAIPNLCLHTHISIPTKLFLSLSSTTHLTTHNPHLHPMQMPKYPTYPSFVPATYLSSLYHHLPIFSPHAHYTQGQSHALVDIYARHGDEVVG